MKYNKFFADIEEKNKTIFVVASALSPFQDTTLLHCLSYEGLITLPDFLMEENIDHLSKI